MPILGLGVADTSDCVSACLAALKYGYRCAADRTMLTHGYAGYHTGMWILQDTTRTRNRSAWQLSKAAFQGRKSSSVSVA